MYTIAVSFKIPHEHREDFIKAALKDGRDSGANEPGTLRFELIADETDPNTFYLNEAYEDLDAFNPARQRQVLQGVLRRDWCVRRRSDLADQGQPHRPAGGTMSTITTTTTTPTARRLSITRADHVAIRVPDYDETIRFYTSTLGFELEAEWTFGDAAPGMRLAYVRLGAFMIDVIGGAEPAPVPATVDVGAHLGYIHLCLRVEDLDGSLAELGARGVEILAEPFVVGPIRQRLALIKDNTGNVIELAQALEDSTDPFLILSSTKS
jgi:catechol 2,3-dioxygenase-like lactoylglutathione lyase family enzyme/quinol monooxygenase YgiN